MHADLQRLLTKDRLPDITAVPLEDLRELRVECSQAEGDVSLVRRVTQGRLDIVGHETRRRAGVEGLEADVSGLLFDLPEIMTDPGGRASGSRPVAVSAPGAIAQGLMSRLDGTASPRELGMLGDMSDDDLTMLMDTLRDFEMELSTTRRRLHERIDSIQGEIVRRYRDGEASIESLLN